MSINTMPKAKLLKSIPIQRYRILVANANAPKAGDVVSLDQGFTSNEGEPMVLVYHLDTDGTMLYEAEVYEIELNS